MAWQRFELNWIVTILQAWLMLTWMVMATFALATALAGVAGLLLSHVYLVQPEDGTTYMLKAYIAVTLGGWGRVGGAVLGALAGASINAVKGTALSAAHAYVPGAKVALSGLGLMQSGMAFLQSALGMGGAPSPAAKSSPAGLLASGAMVAMIPSATLSLSAASACVNLSHSSR